MTYTDVTGTWTTPHGHPANYMYRTDTNDWNTLNSIHHSDEYRLPEGLSGWAFDIGGYLGGVAIALALDNPELKVLCVEPIPDNVRLIRQNLALNGLDGRVVVVEGVVGSDPRVLYGGAGNEHHAFVGNSYFARDASKPSKLTATCHTLTQLLRLAKTTRVAFLKIDVEGAEWDALTDPAVAKVAVIRGEWHPTDGHTGTDLVDLLPMHDVTLEGEYGFTAVLR